jgi:hypothetical protein
VAAGVALAVTAGTYAQPFGGMGPGMGMGPGGHGPMAGVVEISFQVLKGLKAVSAGNRCCLIRTLDAEA